jgi:hypothetical protein
VAAGEATGCPLPIHVEGSGGGDGGPLCWLACTKESKAVRRIGLMLVVLSLPLALGCGSDDDDDNDDAASGSGGSSAGGASGTAGNDTVPSVCDEQTPYDLDDVSGKWAYLEVQTNVVTSTLMADFTNQVVSLQLLDVTQSGTDLSIESSWCDRFIIDPDAPVHAVLPNEFVAALPDATLEGSYSSDADGVWHFEVPEWYQTEGVVLDDVTDVDLLPTEPDDPAVIDQDEDGQPGMTVALQGALQGATYVAQWSRISLDGTPISEERIQGLLDYETRENVLASEPAYIREAVEQPMPDPDPCTSFFVLARLSADDDCVLVNEQRETLFPELPAQ